MTIVLPVVLILLINLWVFMSFFGLGLFGDDWLTIFRYIYYLDEPKHLGLYSEKYFNNFTYLLNAYGSQDTITTLLYKAFGQESNIYFIVSYALRLMAGISIYLPAYLLTKNKLASFFAVFFFLFSPIGLGASSWVFNMPSYLAITFFNLLLFFYLKYIQGKKLSNLFISYGLFILTFLSSPIRSHGLIPFIIFVQILVAFLTKRLEFVKSVLKTSGFFAILFIIYLLGFKETISGNPASGSLLSLKHNFQLLLKGNFDFFFYPIATLGNIAIPDVFQPHGWQITGISHYLFKIFLPIFFVFSTVLYICKHTIGNLETKFLQRSILLAVAWAFFSYLLFKLNPATLANANNASSLLIGGYVLILVINLFIFLKIQPVVKGGLLIALGWTIISYLYPWWQANTSAIFPTAHRYLIISGTGFALLLSIIISLGKNTQNIRILVITATLLLLANAAYTRSFLNQEYQTHNKQIVSKIWSQMPYLPEVGKNKEPMIFYFQGDGTNENILRDSITFGFPPHMALLYKISEEERIPQPLSGWEELVSAAKDGKSIGKDKSVSIERIYAFQLTGKDNLVNVTGIARQKLKELLSNP